MKILLVIDSLTSGGAQSQITMLGKGLAARGHDVSLLNYHANTSHFRQQLTSSGVKIIDVTKKHRFSLKPAWNIRQYVKKRGIDSIVSFLGTPNIYSILATVRLKSVRLVVSERSSFYGEKITLLQRILYFLYRYVDVLTVNSYHQMAEIEERFPKVARRTRVIYNGLELDKFSPRRSIEKSSRAPMRLLAIASLQRNKNPINLIRAIGDCRDRGLFVKLTWVGRVNDHQLMKDLYMECNDLICQLRIKDRWHWFGASNNIPKLLQETDAVIHPSFYEGLSNVVCEAMASGKVVLAGNIGDHAFLLADGRGLIFDPTSPQSIAREIEKMARLSPRKRVFMETVSRQFAERKFDLKDFASSYESVCEHFEKL